MIKINSKKCKGCGLCISVCPKSCLLFSEGFNKSGYRWVILKGKKSCISCGFCYLICPDVCIEVLHKI
ncbi:MAG: 4Fe-4S binding protein [Endomicrobium sp.]|jgi:2-oxoglutarate ferredoxin oxidoreductase subunit delta|nr:4Fe-4S binding protein [Endomicrobium sp.]